jgi:RecB family exonuclease
LSGALATLETLVSQPDGEAWLDANTVLRALTGVGVSSGHKNIRDGVQVLSVKRARARRFDAVFLLGLVDGEFPGADERPSLLTAGQRAQLESLAGGGLFPLEVDQEGGLFVAAVSRAWQMVFLSSRNTEEGGEEARPSHFWELSKELLHVSTDEHDTRTLSDVVFAAASAPSPRHYLRACMAEGRAPHPDAGLDSAYSRALTWRSLPPRLNDPAVLAELEAVDSFTPSALELYLSCPFSWFIQRVIGIGEMELELDRRIMGQLMHEALSAIYRHLREIGLLPLRFEHLADAEDIALSVIAGLVDHDCCPGTVADRRLLEHRLRTLARNLFRMECKMGGSLVVAEMELVVGGENGTDLGGLKLRGRVDRVDAVPGQPAVFALDYKSGQAPQISEIGGEGALQLPLYLMLLAADRPEAAVMGGAYLSLSEGRQAGIVMSGFEATLGLRADGCRILDRSAAEELFRRTLELARGAASGMRSGKIASRSERECPAWCALGPACRSRRMGYRR